MQRIAGLVLLALVAPVAVAEACSCGNTPSATEARRLVDAVFEGTVVDTRVVFDRDEGLWLPVVDYQIAVSQVWKGPSERFLRLRRLGLCDASYLVGRSYLFYAVEREGRLETCACFPVKTSDVAGPDVAALGTPTAVFGPPAITAPRSRPLSRSVRAYVVAGISFYRVWWAQGPGVQPVRMIGQDSARFVSFLPGIVFIQVVAVTVALVRRRWRLSILLFGIAIVTTLVVVPVAGREFLRNDWFAPVNDW